MGTSKKDRDRDKEEKSSSKKRHKDAADEDRESSSKSSKRRHRSRERERSRERSRRKGHSRSRSRSRDRGRDRGKGRDRSRDRSRSRERDSSRKSRVKEKDKDTSKKREGHRHRRHSSSSSIEGERREKKRDRDKDEASQRKRDREREGSDEKEEPSGEEPVKVSSSGDTISLGIEETNKLRAKLGLKPLEVGGSKSTSQEPGQLGGDAEAQGEATGEAVVAKKKEDVHVPAKNIADIKSAEKLKEKMATMRETRRVAKLLSGVKTLGALEDGEDESATNWIAKMKNLQEEKKKAEKKARLLEEMDEEFGVGDLIRETIKEEKSKAYSSGDLSGLKVEHSTEAFREGRDIVLTLKDKGVLDEDDDVLLNVNIIDDEKAAKNVELKKGKPGYNPYEEEEVDEYGNVKRISILKKYDEEIEGEKKSLFELGTQGEVDTSEDRRREIIRQRLKEKEVTLELAPAQVASEYYTAEEMVQFKRPKKKRKIRKKEKLKADDLLPLDSQESTSAEAASKDHGSRRGHGERRGKVDDESSAMEVDVDINSGNDLKDEDDPNMDLALSRTRRLLKRSKPEVHGTAKVLSMLQNVPAVKEETKLETSEGDGTRETIVLDTIAEFCRQVGEKEEESHDDMLDEEEEEEKKEKLAEDVMEIDQLLQEELGGWMEVRPHAQKKEEPKAEDLYQEAEPMVTSGISAALQLASKKGFISGEKSGIGPGETLRTASDARRDLDYERQRKQERERELSRYDREPSFPEKKGYVPDVKLEYVDDKGHLLTTKEAFRFMSHKFHGRGSGKKKIEKRMKKLMEQQLLNKSSSVDTPLNMLSVMQNKQKTAQTPYLVLSGGSQSLLAPNLAKGK